MRKVSTQMCWCICVIIISAFSVNAVSQNIEHSILANAGDDFHSAGIELSWTIGESIVETFKSEGLYLTQGFQQGDLEIENSIETSHEELQVKIYPNPITHRLNIESRMDVQAYCLYTLEGRLVLQGRALQGITSIDLSALESGIYLLIIGESSIFKVIKQ